MKGIKGMRMEQENIWVLSPLVIPFHNNAIFRWLNGKILNNIIRYYMRRLNFKNPILWTYNPLLMEILKGIKSSMTVYHCVDDLTSTPGIPSEITSVAEKKCIHAADLVFTTSRKLEERCTALNPKNTYYFPNVVDFDHFNRAVNNGPIPSDLANIPGPRIGFIGAISEYKVDFELISDVAGKRPDWHWVFIGEIGEGQPGTSIEKLKLPNIHFLGPKEYQVLPAYMRGIDVATLPSSLNAYTSSMFPMKFFEYLAAGKCVVATDLPALREFSKAYRVAKSAERFISAIENCLNGKGPDRDFCLNLAKKYTWEWRTNRMIEVMNDKWEEKSIL
ncbi:MAG: glycosyltransferase [Nitrospiria bacterium]